MKVRRYCTTNARSGLRLRASPISGEVLDILKHGSLLEVLDDQHWLRVRDQNGREGYVSADYTETATAPETTTAVTANIVNFQSQGSNISGDLIRIDEDFVVYLTQIDEKLKTLDLRLIVTSSLRKPDQDITNTVVEPAKSSNHFVGHALDFNLQHGGEYYNSKRITDLDVSQENADDPVSDVQVKRFLNWLAKDATPLRWGGVFATPDPIHLDDALNINDQAAYKQKLTQLWG